MVFHLSDTNEISIPDDHIGYVSYVSENWRGRTLVVVAVDVVTLWAFRWLELKLMEGEFPDETKTLEIAEHVIYNKIGKADERPIIFSEPTAPMSHIRRLFYLKRRRA